jgi:hypothetical protein
MQMKTGFVIAALTVGLLAGGMTGASLADDSGNMGLASLYNADPERAVGDSWQTRGPIETGAPHVAMGAASMDREVASNDAGITFVEIGGVKYRVGLDF